MVIRESDKIPATSAPGSEDATVALDRAIERARSVAGSAEYGQFVEAIRKRFPWRFNIPRHVIERDYLRVVDHHLEKLIPRVERYLGPGVRSVLDFGCGSGGSAIALAMVFPEIRCHGTDIDANEIAVACERAKLYGVEDRCEFHHVDAGQPLRFPDGFFDFCQCSSVLEYATETDIRRFCVREMVRLTTNGGLLFFSVPNRLYPFEIHTGKWGWNYFPKLSGAGIVDCTVWEVLRLARPSQLQIHQTPFSQLVRPWSNFCLKKLGG